MKQNALPSFRQGGLSLSSLNVPRRYHLPIILLRTLSLLPSILGAITSIQKASNVPTRDAGGAIYLQPTQADFWVANLWCMLAGYWSWILTTSMMRRWLYHYEFSNAVVRLVTLTVINWSVSAFVSTKIDSPIQSWIILCCILLVSNVLKLCFASSPKYHQKAEDVQSPRINLKSTAVKVLVLPLSAVTFLTMFVALQQMDRLQYTTSQRMHQPVQLNTHLAQPASTLVLIVSSWSAQSALRRQALRDTSLRLASGLNYRFVLGQPPSARTQMTTGARLKAEADQYGDMLVVPASDLAVHESRKVFEALRWADQMDFDYLVKTKDDVFVRWDTLQRELREQGPQKAYWRGLTYRNMPPDALGADKSIAVDYDLPILPAYTSGTLTILSRDVIHAIVGLTTPQRFIAAEDRNLAVWLFGYDIKPIHDRRIQHGAGCENDLLAKQTDPNGMRALYDNVAEHRDLCTGLDTSSCSLCYSCHGKKDDWRANPFHELVCDPYKGVMLRQQPAYQKVSGAKVKDELAPSVIGENDAWIIDDILSQRTSKYSETADWHLLYWVCWTSDPSTFTDRHWRALELVWIHEPRAVIFMISNTLPKDFFKDYTAQGYNVHVVHFNKENLLSWHWYFGPSTRDWLLDWDRWEKGTFFYWHLTDYVRLLLLYNYGGTYMDMDALWIRVPPDSELEFIGSDYTSLASDLEWTLDEDGLYLPQGLMRFKRGWSLFREMCEYAFAPHSYDPGCFNCHGPKAITSYVKEHRAALESAGFTILPREVLYPASYLEVHKYLLTNPLAEQELKTKIVVNSWNIHLFGKMTNHLPIEKDSLVDHVLRRFDLDVPHRDAKTQDVISSSGDYTVPLSLIGPRNYVYRAASPFSRISPDSPQMRRKALQRSAVGKFQGLDVLYVRGGPAQIARATVEVEVAFGKIALDAAEPSNKQTVTLSNTSKKELNVLLNSLTYQPSPLLAANGGRDRMSVTVTLDGHVPDEILVDVIVVEEEEDVDDEGVL